MNILIIEDEEMLRAVLREILEINGHTVAAAANGSEGLRAASSHPDLILCDVNMPGLDGYQVLEALQKTPDLRDIPFVFLTALSDRASQRHGMELGASDFVTKPFTEKEITTLIATISRRQQPLRERVELLLSARRHEVGADWAHELMTPLNGVLGGLSLIEAEADTIAPEALRELLGIVRAGAERQLSLSTKLVRYFELERAKSDPPAQRSTCEVAGHIENSATVAAQQSGRALDLHLRCESATLPLPAFHLTAAMAELAANAFYFSKLGLPVTLTGTRCENRYLIELTDRGVGMTPAQCADTLPFTQFERGRHNQQGLGLGLSIARSVAEIYGGRLLLRPGYDGIGLIATLDLPCA